MTTNTKNRQVALLDGDKPTKTRQTTQASAAKGVPQTNALVAPPPAPAAPLPSATGTPLAFTEIIGLVPSRLAKIVGLNAYGGLRKETAANLSKGTAQRVSVNGLADLRTHLDGLTSANAIAWGVTRQAATDLCTQSDTAALSAGAIARTRENFEYPDGPGIMMLDHDGLPGGSLLPVPVRDRLVAAAPALATV